VQFLSCSGLHLISSSLSPVLNTTLRTCSPVFSDFGTKLLFNLSSPANLFLNLSSQSLTEALLQTSPGDLTLRLANGTVADVVSVRNYIASWELTESSPGELSLPFFVSL
jgi:hypothetical protein